MKKLVLILWIGLMVSSCSVGKNPDNNELLGTWNWVERSGGFAGVHETPESTQETRRLEITSDKLLYYTNNELVYQTQYSVQNRESLILNGRYDMIIMENERRQIITLNGNSLILTDDFPDGFSDEYAKL